MRFVEFVFSFSNCSKHLPMSPGVGIVAYWLMNLKPLDPLRDRLLEVKKRIELHNWPQRKVLLHRSRQLSRRLLSLKKKCVLFSLFTFFLCSLSYPVHRLEWWQEDWRFSWYRGKLNLFLFSISLLWYKKQSRIFGVDDFRFKKKYLDLYKGCRPWSWEWRSWGGGGAQ